MTDVIQREQPQDHDAFPLLVERELQRTRGLEELVQPRDLLVTVDRALPTPSTTGYTTFRDYKGKAWTCCVCMKEFLTLAQRLAIKRGMLSQGLDIWQLTGGATASAGTHSQGGAFDLLFQTTDAWVKFFRDLGATASWRRTIAQGFAKVHLHGVLNGCPHNSPARYQVTEQKSGPPTGGGDGLTGTKPDYHADPNPYRTWAQGRDYMKRQLGDLAVSTSTSLTATPATNIKGAETVCAAVTSGASTKGTHVYEYYNGTAWAQFASAAVVSGKSTVRWKFGGTHAIRVRFVTGDALYWKSSASANVSITTYDLTALLAERDRLKSQVGSLTTSLAEKDRTIAELQARIDELSKPTEPTSMEIVDVAGFQTPDQVKAAAGDPDIGGIIVKSSQGIGYVTDAWRGGYRELAGAKYLGAYHYGEADDPTHTALAEFEHFVETAQPKSGENVFFDLERATDPAWLLQWLDLAKVRLNTTSLVYTNWLWLKPLRAACTVDQWERLVTYPCWLADPAPAGQFPTIDPAPGASTPWRVFIHQYGVQDYAGGKIDRDLLIVGWDELRKLAIP